MKTASKISLLIAATVAIQAGVLHPVHAHTPGNATTAPHAASDPGGRRSTLLTAAPVQADAALTSSPARVEPRPPDATDSRPLPPMQLARMNVTPRGFIPNVGQLRDGAVKFILSDGGVSACFTDKGFILWNGETTAVKQDGRDVTLPVAPRWSLAGARPVEPVGGETFAHTVSFFRGNDPAKWHASVPAHREIRYREILGGVEMRVESRAHGFEYTFHVAPHAKPDLRFRYDGIIGLEQSLDGGLIVRTATGYFTESRPIAFQWIDGSKRDVASSFEIVSASEYRIVVGTYDERHELIVDPVLDWSTSVGGGGQDQINVIKVDPFGNIVVAGPSFSFNLPTTSGFAPFDTAPGGNPGDFQPDVYIAKFSADGTQLLWAGYLGGAGTHPESTGRNKPLAIDSAGDVYITTHTQSPDFPVLPVGSSFHQGGTDASITKIKADGSAILWSRLLGAQGEDHGYAVAIHENDLYLSGVTISPNFPVTARTFGGMQDAFIAKLDATDGTVVWSSFLGGSLEERISALAADASGVIVFGDTDSADFHAPDFPAPTGHDRILGGNNDTFLTKLDPSGAILWSTYLGGSGDETTALVPIQGFTLTWGLSDMTLDSTGNIIAAGHTYSTDFPGTAGRYQPLLKGSMDGYVAKLTPDASQVLWSTYLGGTGPHDRIVGVAVNPWDEIFVGGGTSSLDFPTTANALKPIMAADGFQDGFMAKLDRDGQQLLYSTYIGNNGWHDAVLALDYGFGKVMIGGWHFDTFFQITQGTFRQECNNCGSETFLMNFLDAFIAHDGFESNNYSGGQGDWAGAWTASGDASILTSSGPHSGTRHVRLRRGTGLLWRTASIPAGSTTLQLGFWSKAHSFEGTEHANVRVRADGGSITTVHTVTSAQSDNTYRYVSIDLTSFLPASQIQVTFDANMGDQNDNWYLDDIRLTGTAGSLPPIANAGPDQSVSDGDNNGVQTVTLNGSASSDPDGGAIVNYEWKEGATVLGTGVSLAVNLPLGVHTITLTVTDDETDTSTDTVQITVNPNQAPIANAGADQTVTDTDNSGAEVVTLNGAASSDPDGSILSYEWKEGAAVLGTGVTLNTSLSVGVHTITLTVTDNGGATASDTVQVTVNAPSAQPTQSHVGDLDGSPSNQGAKNWKATVVVTIHNNASPHQLVSGATVTGTWSGGFTGTFSATTGSNGQCSFATGSMPKSSTSNVTFTITNVQHASLNYSAAANHDPDGDSNGTSITVSKP